jgi:hypothetical protein
MNNVSIKIRVSQAGMISKYLQNTYKKLLLVTVFSSIVTAIVLNIAQPYVMAHVEFSQTSIHVLRIASVANVFLSLFTANSLLLMLTNKIKLLAFIVMITASIVVIGGTLLASSGFENLIFAYLGATIFAGIISTIYANKVIKNASSIIFARLM